MSEHSRQLTIHRETPAFWRVTFRHPPLNLVDHATLQELHDLTGEIEAAQDLKVVVFDSADPDFFLAHWDLASVAPARAAGPALAAVKRTLNRQGLPTAEELQSSQALFYSAFRWPGTAPRVQALQARGLGTRGDVEMRLGEHLRGLPGAA